MGQCFCDDENGFVAGGHSITTLDLGLWTRQHPPEQHAGGKDGNAQHLAGRRLAVEVTGCVIAAKYFHERPEHSVENEVRGEDLAVEFFTPIQPGQRSVKPKVEDRFVNLCRMNTRAVRWVVVREVNRPGKFAGASEATAV